MSEFAVSIRDAHIDAAIREEVLDGSLGGRLDVDEFLERVRIHDPLGGVDLDALRASLTRYADLDPSPSDPLLCAALSVGIQLSAVRVTPID